MFDDEEYITLKPAAYQSLCASKKFGETSNRLTELAYSEDGHDLIVSAEDVILFYNLRDGSKARPVECKKYGVERIEFVTNEICLHSNPNDGIIRSLHIPKKSYLRYFHGHRGTIRMIRCIPSQREKFMSSSMDGTIRMFDTKSNDNFGFMHINSTPLIAFDPDGILFAVATKSCSIKLFDLRSFDLGPFKTFNLTKIEGEEWTDIEFSPCGKFILVSTTGSGVKWVDAFTGALVYNFCEHKNPHKIALRATVTRDSEYVMVGSADRQIYVYSAQTGDVAFKLPTFYSEPSHVVSFNPTKFLLTSLGREVVLWTTSEEYSNT